MAASKTHANGDDRRPRFERHRVSGLYSVAHLFPRTNRCGIYILEFENGERYVGQSVDVVNRFGNHRRVHPDIAYLQFHRCPKSQLNALELQTIEHQRRAGHPLRNITHSLGPLGDSDLDPLVVPSEQFKWLADADFSLDDESAARADDPEMRAKGRAKYDRLRKHEFFPTVVGVLNFYVHACVPKPRETERTFWALSAVPSTNGGARLFTLSINKMETVFMVAGELPDVGKFMLTHVNVSKELLLKEAGSLSKLRREYPDIEFEVVNYESGGGDALAIRADGGDALVRAFDIPGFVSAARQLNMMLMRKGPTFQWRWHNYDLADWLFKGETDDDALISAAEAEKARA